MAEQDKTSREIDGLPAFLTIIWVNNILSLKNHLEIRGFVVFNVWFTTSLYHRRHTTVITFGYVPSCFMDCFFTAPVLSERFALIDVRHTHCIIIHQK